MKFGLMLCCTLLLAPLSFAQHQTQELDPQLLAAFEEALVSASNQAGGRALFNRAILIEGNTQNLLAEMEMRLQQEDLPRAQRIAVLRLQTAVLQRLGELQLALESVKQELELHTDVESMFQQGQLLDCLEKKEEALNVYSEVLDLLPLEDSRYVTLMLRRAMLSMEGGKEAQNALAEFAASESCDAEMRNRAAVVLALLGRPQDAIDLFEVEGEGSKLFRQQIRMAEWALKAEDAPAAQQWAWRARQSAVLKRDRFYALTVLSEAHRLDDSLDRLLEAFEGAANLDQQSRDAWISLLRELGDYDAAVVMFQDGIDSNSGFDNSSRRELLEMYREAGRTEEMVEQYHLLMAEEPDNPIWPEGLSRFYLEQGQTETARNLWQYFLEQAKPGLGLVEAAKALTALGQDDLATLCAERCIQADSARFAALQFLFDMHRLRGELHQAADVLERTDSLAPVGSPVRMQLSESFERIGDLQRAVEVLEQLRSARGSELSEDLEMRLAWLHSEVGNEELALERWRNLWLRVNSIPRRRYVEDRMMSVAARLGTLADIAITLEGKLFAGKADKRDSGLLVRLYTKVGDPVSATEIIDEFLKQAGGSEISALEEKARVFMSCTDYRNYERTARKLISINPEGEGEYLQQIAMSMLERGKPEEARTVLKRLKELDNNAASAEFEAGVLALAGMREEAITAYNRGLANNPDRIESYLMMASLMEQIGDKERAIGMFQDLALNAKRDDLFIIAIDGLLNLDAPNNVMSWARRITLERLARRHDKVYLYQLLADIGEQVNDNEARITALQGSLAIAGDRRVAVVRELMDLSAGRNNGFRFMNSRREAGHNEGRHLAYGRRLIGLGQLVPPQVYLDLGRTFLALGAINDASKTFRLARNLPNYDVFQREVGGLFEQSGYLHQALDIYRKILIGDSTNVGLLLKVAELQEQLSSDAAASKLYRRAAELLLARRPFVTGDKAGESTRKYSRWASRNVDDFDKYFDRCSKGLLVTYPSTLIDELLNSQLDVIAQEIQEAVSTQPAEADPLPLNRYPRLFRRSLFLRRLSLSFGQPQFATKMDHLLLHGFPEDTALLGAMVRERVKWGLSSAAYDLLLASERESKEVDKLLWLVGKGVTASATELVPIDEALRLLLPMIMERNYEDARRLLRRVDFGGLKSDRNQDAGALFAASALIGDQDLSLFLGRNWLRLLLSVDNGSNSYTVGPVLARVASALNDELRRSYYQYFVQLILEDTEKHGSLLSLLPSIQKQVQEPLLAQEKLVELISENTQAFAYNLGPLLQLAPESNRVGLASTVWSEIAPTTRVWFLFNLIEVEVGPLGAEMEDQIVDWFRQLLEEEDKAEMLSYRMDQLVTDQALEANLTLTRRLVDLVTEVDPESITGRTARIKLLMHDTLEEQAIQVALDIFFLPEVQDEDNWQHYQTRYYIRDTILPLAPQRFLDKLKEVNEDKAVTIESIDQLLNLIQRLNNQDLLLQELRAACSQLPDELPLQQRLYRALIGNGHNQEADALLENLILKFPENEELARISFDTWLGRQRPVLALEALRHLQKIQGEPVHQQGVEGEDKLALANISAVKTAIEAEDFQAAGNLLRRIWRSFERDDQRFYFSMSNAWTQAIWPQDVLKDEDLPAAELALRKANQKRRERGGLDAYREPDKDSQPQRNAWEVLAQYPFAVAEMERFLRSNGPSNLETYTAIIDGLAVSRSLQSGPEKAIADLIAKVQAGDAVKSEILQLLSLLENNPDYVGPEAQQVLTELTSSLHPRDGNQLLRLAGVMVSAGARERALDLYRWCATQTSASSYYSYREQEFGSIAVGQLVREMREHLVEGNDMIEVVERALEFSMPGDNPWEQASYQRLVLDTWIGLLEPSQAMQRCRQILAGADREQEYRWNNFSDTAAWLYAHENELDRALECLDFYFEDRGRQTLGNKMLARFFPEDGSEWVDYPAWLQAVGPALLQWVRDNKLNPTSGLQATALVTVRLFEQGATDSAENLLVQLAAFPFENAATSLWIADAARRVGKAQLADSIEDDLFERELLNTWRLLELLERKTVREGITVVLNYGEEMALQRRPIPVMKFMLRLALEVENIHAAETWHARIDDSERAMAEIQAYQEELRGNNNSR